MAKADPFADLDASVFADAAAPAPAPAPAAGGQPQPTPAPLTEDKKKGGFLQKMAAAASGANVRGLFSTKDKDRAGAPPQAAAAAAPPPPVAAPSSGRGVRPPPPPSPSPGPPPSSASAVTLSAASDHAADAHHAHLGASAPPSAQPHPPPSPSPRVNPPNGGASDALLEQLAHISQQLADSRMVKQEVEDENKKLRSEVGRLRTELEARERELRSIKEEIVFTNVEKLEREVKKLRSENEALQKQLGAKEKTLTTAKERLDQTIRELETLHGDKAHVDKALHDAEVRVAQLQTELDARGKQLGDLTAERDRLVADKKDVDAYLERRYQELQARHEQEVARLRDEFATEEKKYQDRCVELEGQRNGLKKKSDGNAKELRKILNQKEQRLRADASIREENARLKEELQRKSKSLRDALEALSVQMNETRVSADAQEELATRLAATVTRSNQEIAQLAQKITIETSEKDEIVDNLRAANEALGKKVLELQEKLKEYEELP
jgi:chromosome segregation ATPase